VRVADRSDLSVVVATWSYGALVMTISRGADRCDELTSSDSIAFTFEFGYICFVLN
jgi:hypothetical protein